MEWLRELMASPGWLTVGWTMVHFLWIGTIIGAVAGAGRLVLTRCSPQVRYGWALMGLAALAAAPAGIHARLHRGSVANREAQWMSASPGPSVPQPSAAPSTPQAEQSPVDSIALGGAGAGGDAGAAAAQSSAAVARPGQALIAVLPWVWLVGAVVALAWLGEGCRRARKWSLRSRRAEEPRLMALFEELCRRVQAGRRALLRVSETLSGPAVVGIVRPVILLPVALVSGWTPVHVEMVLLHELAHIRRHDNLVNFLQHLLEALLFFHPAVWLVSAWVRREREHCCDAFVVQQTGRAYEYAELLARMAIHASPQRLAAAMAEGPVVGRIRRILATPSAPPVRAPWWPFILVLGIVLLLTMRLSAKSGSQPRDPWSLIARLESQGLDSPPQDETTVDFLRQLYQEGLDDFFQREDFPAAQRKFLDVHLKAAGDLQLKEDALFYWWASVGRQPDAAAALQAADRFLTTYPQSRHRDYVLFFKGHNLETSGRAEEAAACWKAVIEHDASSDLAKHARRALGQHVDEDHEAASQAIPYQRGRVLPPDAGSAGPYVVVAVALQPSHEDHAALRKVAEAAAGFHQGKLIHFDGADFASLESQLRGLNPENVLFVIPPDKLDVNFHRRVLLASVKLDADIFPDFSFGYMTARDGQAVSRLWERTLRVHRDGLRARRWLDVGVTSGSSSLWYPDAATPAVRAAGFEGAHAYVAISPDDPNNRAFLEELIPRISQAGVVCLTGNGDPEGIWLFDDHRNVEGDKHWAYAPDKVGHDPKGEMPRITADYFRRLNLDGAVVWSGTCHCAATSTVFVEGDIVSTFGRTQRCTAHRLMPERSLGLAILDAGAVAFLAPIAANHGMSVMREADFALMNGASLGEAVRSTYADVCLAAAGRLRLDLKQDGQPHTDTEPIMQGGGANRILIGDPALRPFQASQPAHEAVTVENVRGDGFDVLVEWDRQFHSRAWDMYGLDRGKDWCVWARVPLEGRVPADRAVAVSVTVEAADASGGSLPYVMMRGEPEVDHGRRYLHLQANAPRNAAQDKAVRARFRVTFKPAS